MEWLDESRPHRIGGAMKNLLLLFAASIVFLVASVVLAAGPRYQRPSRPPAKPVVADNTTGTDVRVARRVVGERMRNRIGHDVLMAKRSQVLRGAYMGKPERLAAPEHRRARFHCGRSLYGPFHRHDGISRYADQLLLVVVASCLRHFRRMARGLQQRRRG